MSAHTSGLWGVEIRNGNPVRVCVPGHFQCVQCGRFRPVQQQRGPSCAECVRADLAYLGVDQ